MAKPRIVQSDTQVRRAYFHSRAFLNTVEILRSRKFLDVGVLSSRTSPTAERYTLTCDTVFQQLAGLAKFHPESAGESIEYEGVIFGRYLPVGPYFTNSLSKMAESRRKH